MDVEVCCVRYSCKFNALVHLCCVISESALIDFALHYGLYFPVSLHLVILLNFYLQTITDLQEFACTLNKFSPVMVSYTTIVQDTKQDMDTVQSTDPTYFVSTVSRVSLCTSTVTCSFIIRVDLCTHHQSGCDLSHHHNAPLCHHF